MIVGAIVVAFTIFVQGKRDVNLGFFLLIGIGFIVFGIGREFFTRTRTKRERPEPAGPPQRVEQPEDRKHPASNQFQGRSPHETHGHVQPVQHPSHPHEPNHKRCPRCQTLTTGHANFCHACGFNFST